MNMANLIISEERWRFRIDVTATSEATGGFTSLEFVRRSSDFMLGYASATAKRAPMVSAAS